jgi:malate synthase
MDRGSRHRPISSIDEIAGPPEPKMAINALNSGSRVWLADLKDANTPHWTNVISSQVALADAVRRRLTFESPEGKPYRLNEGHLATLVVRPRGWHLDERHVLVDEADSRRLRGLRSVLLSQCSRVAGPRK